MEANRDVLRKMSMKAKLQSRDYRDVFGGLLLLVSGLSLTWYAANHYQLGTLQQMGPGMFPAGVGVLLAGFGILLGVQAMFRPGSVPEIRLWSPFFILLGLAAFALCIRSVGLIPAIVAQVMITSLAELKVRPLSLIIACGSLSLAAWLIFSVALGLPILMFRWPF